MDFVTKITESQYQKILHILSLGNGVEVKSTTFCDQSLRHLKKMLQFCKPYGLQIMQVST